MGSFAARVKGRGEEERKKSLRLATCVAYVSMRVKERRKKCSFKADELHSWSSTNSQCFTLGRCFAIIRLHYDSSNLRQRNSNLLIGIIAILCSCSLILINPVHFIFVTLNPHN